jgi:hypothetical protein
MTANKLPELTDAEKAALVDAWFKTKPERDRLEKHRREQGALNTDEARRRRGVDPKPWGT